MNILRTAIAALSLSMGFTAPALAQPSFNAEQWVERNIPDYVRNIPNWRNQSSYRYRLVDLNSDRVTEVIIVMFNPGCGAWECNGYVLQWNGSEYAVIGQVAIESAGGQIFAIPNNDRGMADLVTSIYDQNTQQTRYRLFRFDGSRYQNIQYVNRPSQDEVVLDAVR